MTVLVTGATGHVGSQAVRELVRRGVPVRVFVRDASRAHSLWGSDIEITVGDFADPKSICRAMNGVKRVCLSSADGPDKVAHEMSVIDAAAAAGVAMIVKASTNRAEVGSPLPPFDWNGRIERHLGHSRIPHVLLHSAYYMTNVLAAAEQVRQSGKLVVPAGQGGIAMIDPADIGAVAATIVTSDGHAGATYELTGPEAITYADVADELSAITGRRIEFVDVPEVVAEEHLAASGMPDWLVTHLIGVCRLIRSGELAATTSTVRNLIGREPRTFVEFARDHSGTFAESSTPSGREPRAHRQGGAR